MRIAYFSDNFYPEISGISDSVITTGEELRKRGHEVTYVAPTYPKKEYAKHKPLSITVERLPSIFFPGSPTGQSRIVVPLGFSIPFMKKFKPDVIHSQAPHGAGLEALYSASWLNVPLVGTEHTPITEFFAYSPLVASTFGKLWLSWERFYYNRCDLVTAPYQGLIDEMRSRGLTTRGHAQANPVPFASKPSSNEERAAAKRSYGLTGPTLLCSGRLASEKRVDIILRATAEVVKRYSDTTLLITGHGSAEAALKRLADELGIGRNVRFLGFVDSAELPRLYQASDVYVIMSTAETQSLSLMQAFAAGVPAVSARSHGLVDYTPEGAGFLVAPGDVAGLAERLNSLLADRSLREQMGAVGAAFVSKLSPAEIASQWEELYKSVLSKKS